MKVAIVGLWHLGCVTAACIAAAGHDVIAFDPDPTVVEGLREGRAPLFEPGLDHLIAEGAEQGRLSFSSDADEALDGAEVLWVTFDTPVNERDEADVALVRRYLEDISGHIRPGTLVLTSSQVPVGFTRALERDWANRGLTFAYSPENLRLGRAIQAFREPARVVAGVRDEDTKRKIAELLSPFTARMEWMGVESAEMTKHALNAFLATSVAFINEIARLCEAVGADAKELERGLKSEPRIGPSSYVSPGGAFAGGTLARDVRFLESFGRDHRLATPLLSGVISSNDLHKRWLFDTVDRALRGRSAPVAAILGLTYKPGTDTLRRSSAVELCAWLHDRGIKVQAHDPAVSVLPAELGAMIDLRDTAAGALSGADVAIVSTEWPAFRSVSADEFAAAMRQPIVIDQNRFLAATIGTDRRVQYVSVGATSAPTVEPS
jgi:UDPglucose 6-dehydrogenase